MSSTTTVSSTENVLSSNEYSNNQSINSSAIFAYRKRKYKQRAPKAHSPMPFCNSERVELADEQMIVGSDNEFSDEFDGRNSVTSGDGGISNSPTNDELRRNRAHHNELERRRRDHIKVHFNILRNAIPLLEGEKSSRALILKRAVDYIKLLQSQLKESKQEIDKIKRHNDVLSQATSLLSNSHQRNANNNGKSERATTSKADGLVLAKPFFTPATSSVNSLGIHNNNNNNNNNNSVIQSNLNANFFAPDAQWPTPVYAHSSEPKTSLEIAAPKPQLFAFPSNSTSPTASIQSSPTFSPSVALSIFNRNSSDINQRHNDTSSQRAIVCNDIIMPQPLNNNNSAINSIANSNTIAPTNNFMPPPPNIAELLSLLIAQKQVSKQQLPHLQHQQQHLLPLPPKSQQQQHISQFLQQQQNSCQFEQQTNVEQQRKYQQYEHEYKQQQQQQKQIILPYLSQLTTLPSNSAAYAGATTAEQQLLKITPITTPISRLTL